MATVRQHDLIGTHIDAVRPNTSFGRGRGNGKINRKGARKVAGRGGSQLRHLQRNRPLAPLLAPPSAHRSSDVNNNTSWLVGWLHPWRLPVASRVPLPPKVVFVARGTGFNASCPYLGWW